MIVRREVDFLDRLVDGRKKIKWAAAISQIRHGTALLFSHWTRDLKHLVLNSAPFLSGFSKTNYLHCFQSLDKDYALIVL